jgi:GNAT superfamily N-acetyltransferase
MTTNDATAVRLLAPAAGRDDALVDQLTRLVNGVYRTAEDGLWRGETPRTTASELAGFIAGGEIAVASRHGRIVGSVRVHDVADPASEFGILVADPAYRGIGIGRALIDFVEYRSRERGRRAMQLELLVPRARRHPSKEFLKSWYSQRGYGVISTRSINDAYPHLAPLLATPCDLLVYEKLLPVHDGPHQVSADDGGSGRFVR